MQPLNSLLFPFTILSSWEFWYEIRIHTIFKPYFSYLCLFFSFLFVSLMSKRLTCWLRTCPPPSVLRFDVLKKKGCLGWLLRNGLPRHACIIHLFIYVYLFFYSVSCVLFQVFIWFRFCRCFFLFLLLSFLIFYLFMPNRRFWW